MEYDKDATADDPAGEVDGSHGATRVFFSGRSCSSLSSVPLNRAKDVKNLDATYPGGPTSYVVDDYPLHLTSHPYMAFVDATFFSKVDHGKLAFVVEGTLSTNHFLLYTKIRVLAKWPLLVETQRHEPLSI